MVIGAQLGYSPMIIENVIWNISIREKVCDDHFTAVDAQSACHTLGYTGGTFETQGQSNWRLDEISILMDDVACTSSESNFLDCEQKSDGHDCQHSENVLLKCGSPKREFNIFCIILKLSKSKTIQNSKWSTIWKFHTTC